MKSIKDSAKLDKSDNFEYNLEGNTLFIKNSLGFSQAGKFITLILKDLKKYKGSELRINLAYITNIDSAGVTAIYYLKKKLEAKGIDVKIKDATKTVNEKLELFKPPDESSIQPVKKGPFIESIGKQIIYIFKSYIFEFLVLAADVFYWSFNDLFVPKARRRGEVVNQAVLIGVNATLIVVVMTFIIGLVLALQSSAQLRNFGANIFIVDLTVIAMMAQMGPLITAILVAGRSGSAIAAEIATMKVTAELDALKTMGLNPIRFVIVPKMYGVLCTMPFLVILANIAGIAGGMAAANIFLDISPEVFFNRMDKALQNKDIITGIIKSIVYGGIIVLTGSFYGFKVKEGAEGVGKVTTIAVVASISLVIIADSIMGLIFY